MILNNPVAQSDDLVASAKKTLDYYIDEMTAPMVEPMIKML